MADNTGGSWDEGASVIDFGAVGNGKVNDGPAIKAALESGNSTILFPRGIYLIAENIVFPVGKQLQFAPGALLRIAAGFTMTVNAQIGADLHPIFTGEGAIRTGLPRQTVYPQWFGASGLTGAGGRGTVASGSIQAGSSTLAVSAGKDRFENGQTLMVIHAGPPAPLKTPAAPTLALTQYLGKPVITGHTTFGYRIVEANADGAVSAPSPLAQITNGPDDPAAFEYFEGTRITLTMPTPSNEASGWIIYGEETNPEGHRGLLGVQWARQPVFNDIRNGRIDRSVPPWVPLALPTGPRNNNLMATIVSGGGTELLQLSAAAGASVVSSPIMANDAPALQKAYDFLESGGGGTVMLSRGRFYLHSPTSGDKRSAIYFPSNVETISEDRSILQAYPNFLIDGQITIVGKNNDAHHWGFTGIVFDGGNEVNTTEFFNWIFATVTNNGVGSHTNFYIRNCEFRYIVGKALVTGFGNCENYWLQNNYIHHCNSNAMSVGGSRYYVDSNICEYCLADTPAYIGGAESIIMNGSLQAKISNNTIRKWGNFSAGDTFVYEDIEVSGNVMEDHTGIGFGGYCRNIKITDNMLRLSNHRYISGTGIRWELSQDTGKYAESIQVTGNIIDCTGNIDVMAFNVNAGNTLSRLHISDNTISHQDSTFETIRITNATDVIFADNMIMTDNTASDMGVTATGSSRWVITGNRMPGKNLDVPADSVCTGNFVGGIRMAGSSVVSDNKLDGAQGSSTWGGLINVAGSANRIAFNDINMLNAVIGSAITENDGVVNNSIFGNNIQGIGSRDPESLIVHNFSSTVMYNSPVNSKAVESGGIPTKGKWSLSDKVWNNRPSQANKPVGWICTVAGTVASVQWAANTVYSVNSMVRANGNVYKAGAVTGDARSGTQAPSHSSGTAVDGRVSWVFVDKAASFLPFGEIVYGGGGDQSPPAVPINLTAAPGNGQVRLNWTVNTEPDLRGYKVYRNNVLITGTPIAANTYTDTAVANGTSYSYTVTAIDLTGNESAHSAAVVATPGILANVLVLDSFNRGALGNTLGVAETGQPWIPYFGVMRIFNNTAQANAANANLSIVESGAADCAVIGNLISPGNAVWLILRAKNNTNYYYVSLRNDGYSTFEKVVNGVVSYIGPAFPGAVYRSGGEAKIVMVGNKFDLYYEGVLRSTYNDSFNQLETKHGVGGFWTEGAVDTFKVLG